MTNSMIVALAIGASWVIFSIINICITMAVKKKGGGVHPFFMFCPVINVLCPFVCLIVYLDERQKRKMHD